MKEAEKFHLRNQKSIHKNFFYQQLEDNEGLLQTLLVMTNLITPGLYRLKPSFNKFLVNEFIN